MQLKPFLFSFISVYVLLSLPAIFGVGYVIDWVPEATLFQKIRGYAIEGIVNNYVMKLIIAMIVGLVVSMIKSKKKRLS